MNERFECEYIRRRTVAIGKELRQHRETLRRMNEASEAKREAGRKGGHMSGLKRAARAAAKKAAAEKQCESEQKPDKSVNDGQQG